MRKYAKEKIIEEYGKENLKKIEEYLDGKGATEILIYRDNYTFEIIGRVFTNHSISIDEALELLDTDMDEWTKEKKWDSWDYDALELVDVE